MIGSPFSSTNPVRRRRIGKRSRGEVEKWRPFEEQHFRDRVGVGIERESGSRGEIGRSAERREGVGNLREGQYDATVKIDAIVDASRSCIRPRRRRRSIPNRREGRAESCGPRAGFPVDSSKYKPWLGRMVRLTSNGADGTKFGENRLTSTTSNAGVADLRHGNGNPRRGATGDE